MNPTSLTLITADVFAIALLSFAIYYPRHIKKDLTVAFIGVNIGVLAVTSVLSTANISAGLGLGLFGVLSIIRLRSSQISQREVAYYFASLALGLLGGITSDLYVLQIFLMGLILMALFAVDHPRFLATTSNQTLRIEKAIADPEELKEVLAERLGARIIKHEIKQVDYVSDFTVVNVAYKNDPARTAAFRSLRPTTDATETLIPTLITKISA